MEFMAVGSRQRMSGNEDNITIKLDGSEINKVDAVKSLRVRI